MVVKTDRKDARGIAQLIRMGWFRAAHAKSASSQEIRALLTIRLPFIDSLSSPARAEAIMSFKDVAVKKYVVRLSAEEREYLDQLIRKGKSSAQRLMKARILLKADVGEGGEGWKLLGPASRCFSRCANSWWKRAWKLS
jgi:hypothetical protein